MKRVWLLIVCVMMAGIATGYAKDDAAYTNYEISGAGTATQGCYLVEVALNSKKKNIDDRELKRAAVHGVLFRGFSSKEHRQHQRPLAGSAANEAQHADFYKEFFDEAGTAPSYASIVPGSKSITKSGKYYVIKATVTVNKEELHKYLSQNGIITNLNKAF